MNRFLGVHDRIMEQVLALPRIEEQWESEAVEKKALELLESVPRI